MAFMINTNIAALTAQRSLTSTTNALSATFKRLSSGLRINSAADDAAGLSISDRMTSQIRGFNQSVRNANDTISLIQVAEGALNETTTALQRMRELSVAAANDTFVTTDRTDMQKELNQLVAEIQRISSNTQFNNQYLLQGSFAEGKRFHVGANSGQTIMVSITDMGAEALGIDAGNMEVFNTGDGATDQANAEAAITKIDNAINSVTSMRATMGAMQNRFQAAIASLTNISLNTESAKSRVLDADMAAESAKLTQNSILQQAGTAILAQANQQPSVILQLLR
ncbi:MAG: flagellin FliC [Magnetococcales bacterium]|nr:flagellin FliC [Magnetococcales bacterium]